MLAHRKFSCHTENMLLLKFVTVFASHASANSAWLTDRYHREGAGALAVSSSTTRDTLTLDSPLMKTLSRTGGNVSAAFCVLSTVF